MNFCQLSNTPPKLFPTPQLASEIIIGLCFLCECQRNVEVRSEQHKKDKHYGGVMQCDV